MVLEEGDLNRILIHDWGSPHASVKQRLQQFHSDVAAMIERSLKHGINMYLLRAWDANFLASDSDVECPIALTRWGMIGYGFPNDCFAIGNTFYG